MICRIVVLSLHLTLHTRHYMRPTRSIKSLVYILTSLIALLPLGAQNGTLSGAQDLLQQIYGTRKLNESDTIKKQVLEPSQYKAIYELRYHPTSGSAEREITWLHVLHVGSRYQSFGTYGEFLADSIWDASLRAKRSHTEFYPEIVAAMRQDKGMGKILLDQEQGTLEHQDKILIDRYSYTEPMPQMQWALQEGDTLIAGYSCHKATTRFRGRDYTAWYCESIPLSYGPYKFRGLPGLILCLYDSLRDYSYTLVGFQRVSEPIYRRQRNSFVVKWEQLLKLKKNLAEHPESYSSPKLGNRTAPLSAGSYSYNPIERE